MMPMGNRAVKLVALHLRDRGNFSVSSHERLKVLHADEGATGLLPLRILLAPAPPPRIGD